VTQPEAASSQASSDTAEVPGLADALPAAEHHCRRAVAHIEGRTARGDLLEALVALLEAAGGPDVGNVVRTHLERTAATVPARCAPDRARVRVLTAALCLHSAAERDLRDRLRLAGLVGRGREAPDQQFGRAARARHAERVLNARRSAVDRVVVALGGALPGTRDGLWLDALVGDLPSDLSQAETDHDPGAR
jgi:hypothetical protein